MIYSSVALAAFLGSVSGMIIGNIAKEELPDGRRYFMWLQNLLLGAIVGVLATSQYNMLVGILGGGLAAGLGMMLDKRCTTKSKTLAVYLAFAIPFFYSYQESQYYFWLTASLMFLYGLPTGTLLLLEKKAKASLLMWSAGFIPAAILLFLLF